MYGENVNEWLHPETYNFTREIVSAIGFEDAIDRYVIYQATGITNAYLEFDKAQSILKGRETKVKDADVCELIEKIYGILWPKHILIHCEKGPQIIGDTMNSVNTTMRVLLKKEMNDGNWSKAKTVKCYAEEKETIKKVIKKYHGAEDFLGAAYTIGNFIPVPVDCNSPRGFNNHVIEDYWDLTLWNIYQWYQSMDDEHLFKIVKTQANVKLYKKWLVSFGSWDQFVVANYMQDFVNKATQKDKGVFGKPKELWAGHLEEGASVLPEPKQFDEFFKKATECISLRSARMVNALRAKGDIE